MLFLLQASSFSSALHARLRMSIAQVEERGKKRGRLNLITFQGKIDRKALLGVLSSWVFNYNTVEATLLFAGVIICLCAIMFQARSVGALESVVGRARNTNTLHVFLPLCCRLSALGPTTSR